LTGDASPEPARRPAVLLDRDGNLNVDHTEGVQRDEDFRPIPGAFEAVGRLCGAGWPVAVVTNQSVIARGWADAGTVDAIHRECARLAAVHGGRFDGFHVCPDLPGSGSPRRKPLPGMLFEAAQEHGYDLLRSYMIGDSPGDLLAGRAAGATPLLVLTGKGWRTREERGHPPERTFADLAGAVDWILAQRGG
jgi:D-glycero-D-manno-heptose 1,7-bisphosphate phosphatase